MANKKDGKVIRILDDKKIIINLGYNDGIGNDDRFEIYEPGKDIIDPETKESLGSFDYVKARVSAIDVQPGFSIVSDITTSRETISRGGLSALAQTKKEITKTTVHSLPIDDKQADPQKIKNELIQIGDPVRRI